LLDFSSKGARLSDALGLECQQGRHEPGICPLDAWCRDPLGASELAKPKAAARQMVAASGMVQIAALNSRHTDRRAIDMTPSWSGNLSIKRSDGSTKTIAGQPRNGGNRELIAVGAGYRLVKLITDPPHWSEDAGD
jgi:hypothetical protein